MSYEVDVLNDSMGKLVNVVEKLALAAQEQERRIDRLERLVLSQQDVITMLAKRAASAEQNQPTRPDQTNYWL